MNTPAAGIRPGRMRDREILREALTDLRLDVGHGVLWACGAMLCAVVAALAPQWGLWQGLEEAAAYRAAGGSITIVAAPGRIDGQACSRLIGANGVRAAGATRAVDNLRFPSMPGTPVPSFEVTPSFPEVLGLDRAGSGLVLAGRLADQLGARAGGSVAVGDRTALVSGRYDFAVDGRVPTLGYAVLVPTPAVDTFDECWLDVWPQDGSVTSLAKTVVREARAGGDGQQPTVTVTQLNASLGATMGGSDASEVARSRVLPALGAIGALVLAWILMVGRRVELASARHVGVRIGDQLAGMLIEALVLCGVGSLLTIPALVWFTRAANPDDRIAMAWLGTRGIVSVLAGSLVGTVVGLMSIKERRLHSYVKDR